MFLSRPFASAVRLSLYLRLSERLGCGVQSHCLGAQMHTQCCVLCSLNSVNPSAVPKLRTQASPVFSPLSRIFTLSHRASSQHKFHWKPSSSYFSLSVLSCWLLLSLTKPSWKCFFSRWEEKKDFFGHREMFFRLAWANRDIILEAFLSYLGIMVKKYPLISTSHCVVNFKAP